MLKKMSCYIRMMRIDHWVKQLFVLPGFVCVLFLLDIRCNAWLLAKLVCAIIAVNCIASANYMINEWLDASYDKYHPIKKNRPSVCEEVKGSIVFCCWIVLTAIGMSLGWYIGKIFAFVLFLLWLMGIVYNVKPIRTKDIPVLDVLSESVNNIFRLLLGWFVVGVGVLPPCSLLLGYWGLGSFLMAMKRFAEYRMINNPIVASQYRKSFKYYSESKLLLFSFFYGMISVLFLGIFLIKYKIELILFMPFLMGMFCYYLYFAQKNDSIMQNPEKIFMSRWFVLYSLLLMIVFTVLLFVEIPLLQIFTTNQLITIGM